MNSMHGFFQSLIVSTNLQLRSFVHWLDQNGKPQTIQKSSVITEKLKLSIFCDFLKSKQENSVIKNFLSIALDMAFDFYP